MYLNTFIFSSKIFRIKWEDLSSILFLPFLISVTFNYWFSVNLHNFLRILFSIIFFVNFLTLKYQNCFLKFRYRYIIKYLSPHILWYSLCFAILGCFRDEITASFIIFVFPPGVTRPILVLSNIDFWL